jgi:integrase
MKISDQSLRRLQVPTGTDRKDIYDDATPGLLVRVSANSKTWFVRYRTAGGKYRRFRLGSWPAISVANAREQARRISVSITDGSDPQSSRAALRAEPTVSDLADLYLQDAKRRKRSWSQDQNILRLHVLPRLGALKVREVRRLDVRSLVAKIAEDAPTASARVLSCVRCLLRHAVDLEIIEASPAEGLRPIAKTVRRETVISLEDLRRIWAASEGVHPSIRAGIRLGMLTLQRRAEIAGMLWVELANDRWWRIPPSRSKTKRLQVAYLSRAACEVLDTMRPLSSGLPHVFPGRGMATVLHKDSLTHAFARLVEPLGIEAHFHDLRRSGATLLAQNKVPRLLISKVLGHVEQGATAIYERHAYRSEIAAALEDLAEAIIGSPERGLLDDRSVRPADLHPRLRAL